VAATPVTTGAIGRRAGRPRREGLDEAIVAAALTEMALVGYSRMSLDAIARRAGTTKPTIYTRFPSKAALAAGALESLRRPRRVRRSGDVRVDLIEELARFRDGATHSSGASMLGAVLMEKEKHPELLQLFRRHVVDPSRDNLRRILRAGRDTDQLVPDVDIDLAAMMFLGSFYASFAFSTPVNRDWPERVVDAWLRQNAAAHAPRTTRPRA